MVAVMGHTHSLIGGCTWLGVLALSAASGRVEATAGVALGGWIIANLAALGPDIDSKGSIGSQLLGWPTEGLSYIIRKGFGGHRQITHSLLGIAVVTGLLYLATKAGMASWVALAMGWGWVSHVASDSITVQRCPWLWPSPRKFGIPLVRTNHESETRVVVPVTIGVSLIFIFMLLMGVLWILMVVF